MQFAWLVFLFFPAYAQTAQELFLQANQSYAQKDYEAALKLYEQIPQKGAAVWYNMGNCAYKSGDDLHALLYWNRSQKNSNPTIIHDSAINKAIVMKKLQQSIEPISLFAQIPLLLVQILFFCAFSVFLVIIRIFIRRKKRAMLSLYSVLLIGIGYMTYMAYNHTAYEHALVMHNEGAMYAGPDANYHQLASIPAGSSVTILTRTNDWAKICCRKQVGWIACNVIEII